MIEGSIFEIIAILNIYTSKNRAPKHMKQSVTDSRVKIDGSIIIEIATPYFQYWIEQLGIEDLNNTIN